MLRSSGAANTKKKSETDDNIYCLLLFELLFLLLNPRAFVYIVCVCLLHYLLLFVLFHRFVAWATIKLGLLAQFVESRLCFVEQEK